MASNCTNLEKLIEKIENNELLLPDFQRGFVWERIEQERLVASVLGKMPIGSILMLEANSDDYGCRILGRKDIPVIEEDKDVDILLDGQQRVTVLTNVFSNLLFYDYTGERDTISDLKLLLSSDLQYRFFLEIPKAENLNDDNDLFNLRKLSFPIRNAAEWIPKFLMSDILGYIHVESYNAKSEEPFAPFSKRKSDIIKFCVEGDSYLIPLYLLAESDMDNSAQTDYLDYILNSIEHEVVSHKLINEFGKLGKNEKIEYIKNIILTQEEFDKIVTPDGNIDEREFMRAYENKADKNWGNRMKQYLQSCIRNLDLHQIRVKKSDRERAIDIYENLNLGGVTLSTFELILAKAAKKEFSGTGNLFHALVDYIQDTDSKIYDENLLIDKSQKDFKEKNEAGYSASDAVNCYVEKKNQLNKTYTDSFLNILSLLANVDNFNTAQIDLSLIKRNKILELTADLIEEYYLTACKGLDRAFFFLQGRCGIRKIQEINYNLQLVLLGYLFTDDKIYQDKNSHNLLETWYWLSIFSGRYNSDQNKNIIEDIKNILNSLETKDYTWLSTMKDDFLNVKGFSDKETLTLKTEFSVPKKSMRQAICQFYLSENCKDLMTDEKLNPFCKNADTLEMHHISPIGSLTSIYKEVEKRKRTNNKDKYNSPLNFALITKESNKKISNLTLSSYISKCNISSVFGLNISATGNNGNDIGEDDIDKILAKRFDDTKATILSRVENYGIV